jgi:hypothetical protein
VSARAGTFALLALALASGSTMAAPAPDDFRAGHVLELPRPSPLYELALTRAVYAGLTRADLGDLRVFNGAGEPVPHAIEMPASTGPGETERVALPMYPVPEPRPGESGRLRLDLSDGTTELRLDLQRAGARASSALLLDARRLAGPIAGLTLAWSPGAGSFLGRASVQTSDDLETWTTVAPAAPIATLEHLGERLERNRIPLPGVRTRFLLLRLSGDGPAPAIAAVYARTSPARVPVAKRWLSVEVTPDPERTHRYRFQVPVALPLRSLRIRAPEANTLAHVRVLGRATEAAPWQERGRGRIYRLEFPGVTLENPPLAVSGHGVREFVLEVDRRGGGLGQSPPAVEVGWIPHLLVFVARGQGPFTLAYGSGRAEPSALEPGEILGVPGRRATGALGSAGLPAAKLGDVQELGGTEALSEPTPPADWKRIGLWTALAFGTALLAWLALRVATDLRRGGIPPPGTGEQPNEPEHGPARADRVDRSPGEP